MRLQLNTKLTGSLIASGEMINIHNKTETTTKTPRTICSFIYNISMFNCADRWLFSNISQPDQYTTVFAYCCCGSIKRFANLANDHILPMLQIFCLDEVGIYGGEIFFCGDYNKHNKFIWQRLLLHSNINLLLVYKQALEQNAKVRLEDSLTTNQMNCKWVSSQSVARGIIIQMLFTMMWNSWWRPLFYTLIIAFDNHQIKSMI